MNLQNNSSDHSNNYLKVLVKRGSSVESIHRAHASICDTKGRTLMKAGSCEYETFIRSALKPFQAMPFITSGASEKYNLDSKALALACGSHSGSSIQARTAFKLLWNHIWKRGPYEWIQHSNLFLLELSKNCRHDLINCFVNSFINSFLEL